jgi:hypothetical protein
MRGYEIKTGGAESPDFYTVLFREIIHVLPMISLVDK